MRTKSVVILFAIAALSIVFPGEAVGGGRVVVYADDWSTSDTYFDASSQTFTLNVFDWLTHSTPGAKILVDAEFNTYLSYSQMINTLTANGYTVVEANTSRWTSALLDDFDAVLVEIGAVDRDVLTGYVQCGGGVYVVGGNGGADVSYNGFLASFNMSLSPPAPGSFTVTNFVAHPVTNGVTQLKAEAPTPINVTATGPLILSTQFDINWLVVFETDVIPPECGQPVPAVSSVGAAALALLLTFLTLVVLRRRAAGAV